MMLYFIRHAESEANKNRILASQLPFPLTPAGREESAAIALELKETVRINRIISSPLLRAMETAEPFSAAFKVPIETDDRLSEQNLGIFSGMTYDEVKKHPDYEQDSLKRWNWVPAGGGESYEMIARRVRGFLSDFEKNGTGDVNCLVVTHAVVFRLIRGVLENTLPVYPKAFPNNGEIWKVDFSKPGKTHPIESILLGNSRKYNHNP